MNLLQPMVAMVVTGVMAVGGVTPMVAQEAVVVMAAILEVEAAVVMVVEVIMGQVMVTVVAEPNIAR
ncbi:hypothetical protein ACVSUC_20745 [Yersinia enterocolitica]|uniref:hypothetical protein n=1 Tax=Yersinia enterocolitica TaxID=630 RepID=UPI001CA4BCDE|nr:hypothetical protein [Yersinia enterocolitica]MBW5835501.1 hypothetical protein [Yersinia enterocolitica]